MPSTTVNEDIIHYGQKKALEMQQLLIGKKKETKAIAYREIKR